MTTENTEETGLSRWIVVGEENTAASGQTKDIDAYLSKLSEIQASMQISNVFASCSDLTGGYVQVRNEYYFIPVIVGQNQQIVPLYQFVEVLDEVVDYDSIREELPALSYSQIGGAMSFLRKMTQHNPQHIDIDRLEDEHLGQDQDFIQELRKALADEETSRVLTSD